VANENLLKAFSGRWTEEERDALVRSVYRHFCILLIEIIQIPRRLHPTNWRQFVDLPNGRRLVDALLQGRPLLFVTGHYGNWELGGYILGLLGFRTWAIARPLDNPYLDEFLRSFRERTGQGILAKHGDFDKIEAILASGGIIATLGDQDAGQRGLFVDFFGQPASTHKAIALLSLEHQVPLAVIGVRKVGEPMHYHIVLEDHICPEDYQKRPDVIRAMTQRFTSSLERLVQAAPQQYFWLHRRWKHQPPQKKVRKAG
jgi:KDO2-lipid IV(A) lauroyltransferase